MTMTAVFVAITGPVATFLLALLMRAKFLRAEKKTEEIHVLVNSQMASALDEIKQQGDKILRLEAIIDDLQEAKVAAVAVADAVQAVQEIQANDADASS